MSLALLLALAAVTYGSRALALVLLPDPPAAVRAFLDRIPAPLFGGLGALALLPEPGASLSVARLAAAVGAACTTPWRSLPLTLVGGLLGYGIGWWLQ
ncbi:MAG: AzlD domain-containing protein [Armatimonadetes bacterium]|nr:AzlD domain-containing protein [Armatimonadota bacterium]